MIAVVGWMMLFLLILPGLYADMVRRTTSSLYGDQPFFLMPFLLIAGSDSTPAVGLLPWLSTAALCAFIATWRFRTGLDSGWDPVTKAWPGGRRGWILHVAVQLAGWGFIQAMAAGGRVYDPTENLTSSSAIYLILGLGTGLMVSGSTLYVRTMMWLLPRLGLSRSRFRFPLFGDPVLWRELLTKAGGGLNWGVWAATGIWLLIVLLFVGLYGPDGDVLTPAGLFAGLGALTFSVLVLVASINEDRRARTLPLLLVTTYRPARIVVFKTLAAALRVGPLIVLGTLALVIGESISLLNGTAEWGVAYVRNSSLGPPIFTWIPASRLIFGMMWGLGLWLAALGLTALLAVRLKAPAAAWSAPVLAGIGLPIALPFAAGIGHQLFSYSGFADAFTDFVFPVASRSFAAGPSPGVPVELVLTGLFWWTVGILLVAAAAHALRRVGASRR